MVLVCLPTRSPRLSRQPDRELEAYRAALASARVNSVINASTTPAATASAARTTLARLTTLLNELQTSFSGGNAPASSAAPATVPTALELQLAAALDEATALLSYLS